MQFGFMPGRRTTDAFFLVRRMQEEYRHKKKKLYCFVDIERRKKKKLCSVWGAVHLHTSFKSANQAKHTTGEIRKKLKLPCENKKFSNWKSI